MQQQINLFTFVKLPVKTFLTAPVLLQLYGAMAVLLMLVTIISSFHESHLRKQNDALKISLENARKHLVELAGQYPTDVPSQLIDSTKLPICNVKFSLYLEGFAEAYVAGVWLTQININSSGKEILLHGNALRLLQVQQYLLALKQQDNFKNYDFTIQELNDKTPPVTFIMVGKAGAHG